MSLTRTAGPTSRALVVRLDDGSTVNVRGRRAAIIRHLLIEALYLDDPAMSQGKLEISWDDRQKLDVNCTRYGRELWGAKSLEATT